MCCHLFPGVMFSLFKERYSLSSWKQQWRCQLRPRYIEKRPHITHPKQDECSVFGLLVSNITSCRVSCLVSVISLIERCVSFEKFVPKKGFSWLSKLVDWHRGKFFCCKAAFSHFHQASPAFYPGFEFGFTVCDQSLAFDAWLLFAFAEFRRNWLTLHWIHRQTAGKWMSVRHRILRNYQRVIRNIWVVDTCVFQWRRGCFGNEDI